MVPHVGVTVIRLEQRGSLMPTAEMSMRRDRRLPPPPKPFQP